MIKVGGHFKLLILIAGFLYFSFGCHQAPINRNYMELSEAIKQMEGASKVISDNFEALGPKPQNPIFPYKISYRCKSHSLLFCNLRITDAWALKSDSLFTFFLLLKNQPGLSTSLIKCLGDQYYQINTEVNDIHSASSLVWESGDVTVTVRNFSNIYNIKEYDECSLVIVGNMNHNDIYDFPAIKQ